MCFVAGNCQWQRSKADAWLSPMPLQSSVAAAAATLGNLKLGDSKVLAWNFENFVDGVKAHRGDLSWRAVAERLDVPGFSVADAHAFSQLVRI